MCAEITSVKDQEPQDLVLESSIYTPSNICTISLHFEQRWYISKLLLETVYEFMNETCSVKGNYDVAWKRGAPVANCKKMD